MAYKPHLNLKYQEFTMAKNYYRSKSYLEVIFEAARANPACSDEGRAAMAVIVFAFDRPAEEVKNLFEIAWMRKPPSFDNCLAETEGWMISDCDDAFQLQKDDADGRFEGDDVAMRFVAQQASYGSAYHVGALAFIREHSPEEFKLVEKALGR